ncbi:unnamed protein product [Ilex paraguariensis]|uniref:Uncharacterized protein n=1 Tax=Ilex paraguariensis TaxID=185542 RepID=A0ABC8RAD2_9AQUA
MSETYSCNKLATHSNVLDFMLYRPEQILERIELPRPRDLDSLLLDAAKPVLPSRNTSDPSGKPVSRRTGLPHFPWSYTTGVHQLQNA